MQPPTITPRARFLLNAMTAAVVMRFLRIADVSLWADEGVTWANATRGSWSDTLLAEANHPPVWNLLTRVWISLAGDSEMALRAPAALCSALAVWLAFLLARRLCDPAHVPSRGGFTGFDDRTPLWVAGLAAASAFSIEYGQEARMYSALLACSLGLSLLYLRWLDTGRRTPLVGYTLLAVLALHTHYFALWPLLAHAVHALWTLRAGRGAAGPVPAGAPGSAPAPGSARGSRPLPSPQPLLVSQGIAALLFVPWLVHLLSAYRRVAPAGVSEPFGRLLHALWRMGTGPAVAALDRPRVDEGWQATLSETWPVVLATALLWAVPIAFGVRAVWRDRGARRFVLASVLVPIAAVLLLFPFFPLVHEKYLIFLWPFLLLLAVVGARSARGFAKPALLAGLVLLHAVGLVAYHGVQARPVVDLLSEGHAYGKEQWFEAHRWISNRAREGDVVLVHCRLEAVGGPGRTTPIVEPVWSYYDRERSPRLVPLFLPETAMSAEEFGKKFGFLSEARAVFLVLSHEETEPKDAWARTLHEFFFGAWGGFESEREDFPRSWGIRVWRFARGA